MVEFFSPEGEQVRTVPLEAEPAGYFAALVPDIEAGARYRYRLDRGSFPDPASRWQPEGPHGPSQVVDPETYRWLDAGWCGRPASESVIYEMHLGTFTREGTWRAAMRELDELKRIGITVLEVMPVADFPGEFGWGYDGVGLFAPTHLYGTVDDAKAFVDRAHALGLMVILDVVYNHLGPDGNYLRQFSPDYFSTKHKSEWGDAMNFDGPNAGPVREFFISNAKYWISEYHFDGLRLDATQQIKDNSPVHVLREISEAARAAAPGRTIYLVAENETQESRTVRAPAAGGHGMDAVWNDDFHHCAVSAVTGTRDGYYVNHHGSAQEFVSALKYGFLYQGQWYPWQKKRRGTPAFDVEPSRFVIFLDNHDQVANSLRGERLHQLISPSRYRALTAVLLLARSTPLLFQGQEFAASAPFVYFADHEGELRDLVTAGRHAFVKQFRAVACSECDDYLPAPAARETFERCKLDFSERTRHAPVYQLHQDLLRLRREDRTIAAPVRVDGAVLGPGCFVMRYFANESSDDRLLLVNLGGQLHLDAAPEPLLAPPEAQGWRIAWSSEAPDYGGSGSPSPETAAGWIIMAGTALLLKPVPNANLPTPRLAEKD